MLYSAGMMHRRVSHESLKLGLVPAVSTLAFMTGRSNPVMLNPHTVSMIFKYLTGIRYLCNKEINKKNRYRKWDHEQPEQTSAYRSTGRDMGRELGMHHTTVEKYAAYAVAANTVADLEPELFEALKAGTFTVSMRTMFKMAPDDGRRLKEEKRRYKEMWERKPVEIKAPSAEQPKPLALRIKEMPVHDPDMELNGLAYTVPTWTSAIKRACEKTDMMAASLGAKKNLSNSLSGLLDQINITLEVIGE